MKLIYLIFNISFATITIKPDPDCIIRGGIEYIFGSKKEIDRPINCVYNENAQLTFCEGDEVKVPKEKNHRRVLTLVNRDEMLYYFAPNYGYKNQNAKITTVENFKNYSCTDRLAALNKEIKWVVINESRFQDKPKENKTEPTERKQSL